LGRKHPAKDRPRGAEPLGILLGRRSRSALPQAVASLPATAGQKRTFAPWQHQGSELFAEKPARSVGRHFDGHPPLRRELTNSRIRQGSGLEPGPRPASSSLNWDQVTHGGTTFATKLGVDMGV